MLLWKRGDPELVCAEVKYVLFPNLNNEEDLGKTLEISPC